MPPRRLRPSAQLPVAAGRTGPLQQSGAVQPLPQVTTLSASNIGQTSATLNGSANPEGVQGIAWIAWGNTPAYGQQTSPPVNVGSLAQTVPFSGQIAGLKQGVTYHYAAVVQTSAGTVFGQDMTVTLTVGVPDVLLPQFDAPFRFDSIGRPVVVEQGSLEEVGAQIYNVLVCPQGAKFLDPKFGTPSPLFGSIPLDLNGIVKSVQARVPGATVDAVQEAIQRAQQVDVSAQVPAVPGEG